LSSGQVAFATAVIAGSLVAIYYAAVRMRSREWEPHRDGFIVAAIVLMALAIGALALVPAPAVSVIAALGMTGAGGWLVFRTGTRRDLPPALGLAGWFGLVLGILMLLDVVAVGLFRHLRLSFARTRPTAWAVAI
jgi:hypothetical protein